MIGDLLKRLLAIGALALLLVPPLPLRAPLPAQAPGELRAGRGSLRAEGGRIVLHLAGTPYEMGYQQGALLGPQIRWLLGHAVYPSLLEKGLDGPWLIQATRLAAEQWPAPLWEEARGIADSAGVAPADIVLLNLWPDLLLGGAGWKQLDDNWRRSRRVNRTLADRPGLLVPAEVRLQRGLPALAPGPWPTSGQAGRRPGSGFWLAAWNDATADRRPLLAGLLEAYPAGPHPLLVERRPERGLASLGVALPGWVGLTAGLNEAQVAVLATMAPTRDRQLAGVPVPLLVRMALERSRESEQALRRLVRSPRVGGAQVLIASGAGGEREGAEGAMGVELSARLFRVLEPEPTETWLMTTPLPLSPELAELAGPRTAPWQEAQRVALDRVAAWLRLNRGFIDQEKSLALLTEMGGVSGETWVALVVQPSEGRLWIAQPAGTMPAPAAGFTSLELTADTSKPGPPD